MNDETKTIHRKQFMEGRMTPEELHNRALSQGGTIKCPCGLDPVTRIVTFADVKDLMKHEPEMLAGMARYYMRQGLGLPCVEFTYGKFVKIGDGFFCEICSPEMEKKAARELPDWVLVEVRRGPGKTDSHG
jgi:hypothetical protein